MAKRIVAFFSGGLVLPACLLPLGYAFEILKDFRSPEVSFWPNVLGILVMASIATTGSWLGIRFLRFALSGREAGNNSWVKPVLLGIGFFFPGFAFSFPVLAVCVTRIWLSDDTKLNMAFGLSGCIGVIAAITCAAMLLRKRARDQAR